MVYTATGTQKGRTQQRVGTTEFTTPRKHPENERGKPLKPSQKPAGEKPVTPGQKALRKRLLADSQKLYTEST
ncbi:hypothetical protein SNE510_60880 [Streptomyces sp. NE5-10]|nr:hypothetical protein SNE510_60880 [Streptomyces sp. NE5-10]